MPAPTGTITFMFTDIEGSTVLWESSPDAMQTALAAHDGLLRRTIEERGGYVFATGGDGFCAAFARARDAAIAATTAQGALAAEPWPGGVAIAVRMALHTGEAEEREGDYFGPTVNRAARLMALGHGGQVLCSSATAELLDGVELVDLGEHRLRDLSAPVRVYQLGAGRFPPLRSVDAFPGNLPLQVSSFIGREREVDRTTAASREARVVTLTGVGGVGKTRLALQVAAESLPRFRDGAWLVELAAVRDPADVAGTVAAVLDVTPRAGQTVEQALVELLGAKKLLLVLDNCEHLLGAVARLVGALERSCPYLTVLATSREGLGIDGERILAVPSLAAPEEDADVNGVASAAAVRLFVERAQALKAEFTLTPANAPAVAQVCRRLDGVPLAIELAAARIPAMSPAELARRLERRFDVLAGGRRGAVERHQTLRAAIDWSYELLGDAERRLFARLSVFAGGCTLDAAEAVCGGGPVDERRVWEMMAALVAQSLVVAEDYGLDTRYRLLETIRQYGEERLDEYGETASMQRRHREYYAGLAPVLRERSFGPEQDEWLDRIAIEQDNLLRAMHSALDAEDADVAIRLLYGVPPSVMQAGGYGFRFAAEPVLAIPGASEHSDYPIALAIAGLNAAGRGELKHAEAFSAQAVEAERRLGTRRDSLVDDLVSRTGTLRSVSIGAWREAAGYSERCASINRSEGRRPFAAADLCGAAQCYAFAGDTDAAIPVASEALALAREVAMPTLVAQALSALANAIADRDPERARALLQESLDLGAKHSENTSQVTQATLVATRLGDGRLALALAARAVPRAQWHGNLPQLAGLLNVVAWAAHEDEAENAAVLLGAARRLAVAAMAETTPQPSGTPGAPTGLIGERRREATRRLASALGDQRVRQLRAEGEAIGPDDAVRLALAVIERTLAL